MRVKPVISKETREKMRQSMLGKKPKNLDWLHAHNKGENHGNWKGDKVGNGSLHDWVKRWKGKPEICEKCGASKDEKKLTWANKDHTYKRNLDDFISLCYKCHQQYDIEHNNWKSPGRFKKGHIMTPETRKRISEGIKEFKAK